MSTLAALGRMSLTVGSACTGTMPKAAEHLSRNSLTGFMDAALRGVGMAGFANNPISGVLFLAAAFSISPWLGIAVIFAGMVSTGTALALSLDRHDIRAGLYGYNGALVGGGFATFLVPAWDVAIVCYIIAGAALSTVVMAGLIHVMAKGWGVPPVAIPFNLIVIGFLLAAQTVDRGRTGPLVGMSEPVSQVAVNQPTAINIADALAHGFGQVVFAGTLTAAALVLTGILICCWYSALLAVLGSATAALTAAALGTDPSTINMGLLGLNGFLTCVALGGIFVQRRTVYTVVLGIVGAATATVTALALNRIVTELGLPGSITLAYCIVTPLFVGVKFLSPRLHPESSAAVSRASAPVTS
jgi:urea transporter